MPRLTVNAPAQTAVHTKRYTSFKGVDFSMDPTQVDDSRSPWAVNVISDGGGCPQKRPGWRKLASVDGPVYGIYQYKTDETQAYIVHAGGKLYSWQGGEDAPVSLLEGLTGTTSDGFMWKDKLYILTGAEYVYVAEEEGNLKAGHVSDIAYVPVTRYEIKVQAEKGTAEAAGGEDYDVTNIVTKRRKNSFILDTRGGIFSLGEYGSETVAVFFLDKVVDKNATRAELVLETEDGVKIENILEFARYESNGERYEPLEKDDLSETVVDTVAVCAYYEDLVSKFEDLKINFNNTEIQLTVTYPAKMDKEDLLERIPKCRMHSFFENRLFVAGNPEYANADFFSELNEPTYFKEINYTEIGSSDILGYLKTGEQLAIIKESSLQDVGVYLRRGEFNEQTGQYFPVRQGVTATGAVGFKSCASLVDDPMYLSTDGVMGVISDNISGERVIHRRSTRVNNKLLREPELENAVCATWNGYFVVAVNGGMYLADSRQRTYARNVAGNYEYEWFYWDAIMISCILPQGDTFFFGTSDGKLCRLNTDMTDDDGALLPDAYADYPDGLSGEAKAIVAEWSTKFDDDGDFMIKKNMVRRGNGVFLKASRKGNVKIAVRTDKELERVLAHRRRGVFDYNDLSFENFTFATLPKLTAAVNKKVKKYTAIQVICRSDEAKHDFGVLGIERRFVLGYFNK